MYLLFLMLPLSITYVALYFLWPWLFRTSVRPMRRSSLVSLFVILALFCLILIAVVVIPSIYWGNRVQHTFGGGFLATVISFLAVRDSGFKIDSLRFFILTFMIVMMLGVCNELLEFALQSAGIGIFADSPTDTWLDLLSNAIGAAFGGVIFAPFVSRKR